MEQARQERWGPVLQPMPHGPRAGEMVDGRFVLERLGGSGSAGRVYRALDLETGEAVALKLFHAAWSERPERALREARALAAVRDPAVARYVAHGVSERGVAYLAMAWIEGETLAARLSRGGLTPRESLRLATRLAGGLAALHACGIVHRDLKPSNVLLEHGSVERACIVDLSVAHDVNERGRAIAEGAYVGTPRYMAPEQIRAPEVARGESDVFALGCILYECLCGVLAFGASEVFAVFAQILFGPAPIPSVTRPELPAALDALLAGMLAPLPEHRPRARELIVRLDAALGACGLALSRLAPPERAARMTDTDVTVPSGIFEK